MPRTKPGRQDKPGDGGGRLYTLEAWVLEAPVSHQEAGKGESASRTIQILGSQTLSQLHGAIFSAFGRKDPHLYEFQFGGEGEAKRRFRSPGDDLFRKGGPPGNASRITLDSLGLERGQAFGYLFDFGDCWQHQIEVVAVGEGAPKGNYPRVVLEVGKSPPQYVAEE